MRVATAQMQVGDDLAANTQAVRRHLAHAAQAGVDVLLCPETALTGYLGISRSDLSDLSPLRVHDALEELRLDCRVHSCALIVGQYFKRCGLWYNNAVAINRSGRIIASYDKAHLVDLDCYEVTPGREI